MMTKREKEILQGVISGKTNQQIANELFISVHTVKAHLDSLFRKAGVLNRVQLAVFALENGFK